MKKLLLLLWLGIFPAFCLTVGASYGSIPVVADNTGKWEKLSLKEVTRFSIKDYARITGKKITLKERIAFSVMKLKMKKALKKNPELTVGEFLAAHEKLSTGWIVLIVILGLLLLLVLIFLLSGGLDIGI